MAYYSSSLTTPAIATDSLLQRTVADEIRRLLPSNMIMSLVSPGAVGDEGVVQKKNMIAKRRVDNRKYERFTYSPAAIEFTIATYTDVGTSSGFTVSSADGLRPKYCLLNTANMTVMRIESISSTTIKGTSVGSTAFSASVSDKLLKLAPAYEQNSSSPYLLMKDEDNHYGYTQIARFPVGISGSNREEARFGPDYYKRIKGNNVIDGFRTVELTCLFGTGPSSGATTTGNVLGDAFQTTKGLWSWSSSSYDAKGNLTAQKFRKDMVLDMAESVRGNSENMLFYVGQEFYGDMQEWVNDKMIVNDSGEKKVFGTNTLRFHTSGPMMEVTVHDAFTRGSLVKCGLNFKPQNVEFVFLKNRDFAPKNDIQANDVDGYVDEIRGEFGMDVLDGGEGVQKVTNIY